MTTTKMIAGLSIAIGALASAQAQTPTATAAAAPAAAAPAPVTPAMRAAVKELLDITKTRDNLARTFQAMGQNLPQQMAQAINVKIEEAPITPEQKQKVREGMNQPFAAAVKEAMGIIADPKGVDQAIDKIYPIYAKHFSLEEIKQLIAFYKSPVGAKTLTEMPQIINETMQSGMSQFQPKLTALVEKTARTQIDAVAAPAKK